MELHADNLEKLEHISWHGSLLKKSQEKTFKRIIVFDNKFKFQIKLKYYFLIKCVKLM